MEKWVLAAKRADFQEIGRKYGIDPVIARIIRNRDITEDAEINQYLNGTLDDIPSWKSLKDIDKAVEIISQKIDLGTRMRIIGDYDIDGVTATYILLKGFKRLGANVDTYIPDRIADGYGIHNHLIEKAKEDGVDTIVTCDNGISAADQIAFAKKMGMTVVVTDHHEVPFEDTEEGRKYKLPLADAIINPKQSDCTYPNKNICGAVVAMKLVFALYEKYGIPESEKEDYLEHTELPEIVKNYIRSNGGDKINGKAIGDYVAYVVDYLTDMVMNGLSYLLTIFVVLLLVLIALALSHVLSGIPVVGGLDKAGGLAFGVAQAVLCIWIAMVLITFLSAFSVASQMLEMVHDSKALTYLYDKNIFLKIVIDILGDI